jgi:D-alanyl-D-alanine dipeptidase
MAIFLENWREIPIIECRERLVSVSGRHPRLSAVPQYFRWRIEGALNDCLVRETVCAKLIEIAERLPGDLRLVVWDGWRSKEVQTRLFEAYRPRVVAENPQLDAAEIDRRTSIFVSLPSSTPNAPSPHNTGGAVDLTLADAGEESLPMGTAFDDFSPMANTAYFDELALQKPLSEKETRCSANRRILCEAMSSLGFVNYPNEWWHFDYGNQWWAARIHQAKAYYGPALPVAENSL